MNKEKKRSIKFESWQSSIFSVQLIQSDSAFSLFISIFHTHRFRVGEHVRNVFKKKY